MSVPVPQVQYAQEGLVGVEGRRSSGSRSPPGMSVEPIGVPAITPDSPRQFLRAPQFGSLCSARIGRFMFRPCRGCRSRRRRIGLRVCGGSRLSSRGLRDRRRRGARTPHTRNPSTSRGLTVRRSRTPRARATSTALRVTWRCSGLGCRGKRRLPVILESTRFDDSLWGKRFWWCWFCGLGSSRRKHPGAHRGRFRDGARVGWVQRVMKRRALSRRRPRHGSLLEAMALLNWPLDRHLRLPAKDLRRWSLRRWAYLKGRFSRHGPRRGRRGCLKSASDRLRGGRFGTELRLVSGRFGAVETNRRGLVTGRRCRE